MPPRPLMADGCDRAAVFPACRRLCTCTTMDSRPVKNGLRRNGTFQTGSCTPAGEVLPAVIDGLAAGLVGEGLAFKSSMALLMPLITSANASSCVGQRLTGFACEGSTWSLAKGVLPPLHERDCLRG